MILDEFPYGYKIETADICVVFGNKNSSLAELKSHFAELSFHRTQQIHSDIVVQTEHHSVDYTIQADAQISQESQLALCSITADCIPVLIYNSVSKEIAAVHAGWRGVENEITLKTLQKMKGLSHPENFLIFVGPHIHQQSFICGADVKDRLTMGMEDLAIPYPEQDLQTGIIQEKYKVHLLGILLKQLDSVGIPSESIFTLYIDTFADPRFHSHRRDKEKAGRQISFIYKKKSNKNSYG